MNTVMLSEALLKYRPHRGLAAASLIDKFAGAPGADLWRFDLTGGEQEMLGRILAEDDQVPSLADVERAMATLVAKRLRAHEQTTSQEIARAEASGDTEMVSDCLFLKRLIRRALDGVEE